MTKTMKNILNKFIIGVVVVCFIAMAAYVTVNKKNIPEDIIVTDFGDENVIKVDIIEGDKNDPEFKKFLESARIQDEKNKAYFAEIEEKKRLYSERLSTLTKRDEVGNVIPDDVFGIADEVIEISDDKLLNTEGWQLFKDDNSNFSFLYLTDKPIKWWLQNDSSKWWLRGTYGEMPPFLLTTSELGLPNEPKPGISMSALKGGLSEKDSISHQNWAKIKLGGFQTDKLLVDWMREWFYAERGCKGCPIFPRTMQYVNIGGLQFITTPFFDDVLGNDLRRKIAYYQVSNGKIVTFQLVTQNGIDNTKEVELLHNTFYTLLSTLSLIQ